MPFTLEDLEYLPISFCKKDEVHVIVGPCSAMSYQQSKIILDGRKYKSGGTITLKNGLSFRASFYLDTTNFTFIIKESIYLHVDDSWYNIEESALLSKIGVLKEDIYPLTWQTDKPLDYHIPAPYTLID